VFTATVYVVIFGKFAKFRTATSSTRPSSSRLAPDAVLHLGAPLSSTSLVANVNLVTKVYFPRVLLPIAEFSSLPSTS